MPEFSQSKRMADAGRREAEDMALARAAYEVGRTDALAGVRKCDPRVVLSAARSWIDDRNQ